MTAQNMLGGFPILSIMVYLPVATALILHTAARSVERVGAFFEDGGGDVVPI